jgi:DNA repair protein RadC
LDSIIAARLKTAAEAVRMTLRDHIILAEERYFSFKENKKL